MAKKNGLSAECLNAIIAFAEQSSQYQDYRHNCRVHDDKAACTAARKMDQYVTQPAIDNLFRHCGGK